MTIVVSDKITGVFSPMNGEALFILGGVPHAVTNMINNQNALKKESKARLFCFEWPSWY